MGICLPERVLRTLLTERITAFNRDSSILIPEMFTVDMYGKDSVNQLIDYFNSNPIKIKTGYPKDDLSSPTVYVVPGDSIYECDTLGPSEQEFLSSGVVATSEGKFYTKTVRVISVSDNETVTPVLNGICEYFLHMDEERFNLFNMLDLQCVTNELDFLSKFYPQGLFCRSIVVKFKVMDTIIVSKDDLIEGIEVTVSLIE